MNRPRLGALALAALLIHLSLIQPNHPGAATWGALRLFPLELPPLLIALVLASGRAALALRAAATAFLALMTLLKAADLGVHTAFGRPFNPLLDLHLASAGWRMLSGAIGFLPALAAAAAVALALALLAAALWWATGRIAALDFAPRPRAVLALLLIPALALAAADAAREASPLDPPGAAFTARLAWEHARDARRARADLAAFRREAAEDPVATLPPEAILAGLRETDVYVTFVESYGRTALDTPLYAPTIRTTLQEIEARLKARGLATRSAFLTAPMTGGQSWLAHASVLSGLRIENQGRYAALLASPRRTLLHLARAAGWRTLAVMPAITLPWPEAAYFGYDRILAAADLGYAGRPFNWITMPDQFTLASFERQELSGPDRPPVFAVLALISSHAPWTPIPPLLPWESLGDGRVFDPYAAAGDAPETIWRDPDRVRDQFRQALDYSLRVVGAFAERRAEEAPLMIVLGDHQPAGFVALGPSRDVPVHVIGPPEAVARFEAFDWTPGLIPAPDAPVWGMESFRDRFLEAYEACPAPGALPAAPGC